MNFQKNCSLRPFNTFSIDVQARYFAEAHSIDDVSFAIQEPELSGLPRLVIGGGSNVLFTKDFDGLVLKIGIAGMEIVSEDDDHYYVKAGAGENWHGLVRWCIENNYAGIENLSLIPGCVGAAPMQNIGAYGVELKEVFHELEALDIAANEVRTFSAEECHFGYRDSIFKQELKDKVIITSVTLRLNKHPQFNTTYGALEQELDSMGVTELSIGAISEAVCHIRSSKLPDPAQLGNAGSFFKNPVIDNGAFNALKDEYPEIVGYPDKEGHTKVAAGWLIDKAGWKGKRLDNYGVHEHQALVLVNYGDATGQAIYDLSEDIRKDIEATFGIALQREVNVV